MINPDTYIHLAARLDESPSSTRAGTTDKLRALLPEFRPPLVHLSEEPGVVSSRFFRAAWLSRLRDDTIFESQDEASCLYDIVILVRLADSAAVSDVLDHDAMRELLRILHTFGRSVVITPARNVSATGGEAAHGALSLICHRHETPAADRHTWWNDHTRLPQSILAAQELLVPIDPATTPLRSIRRAELAPPDARALVTALARATTNQQANAVAAPYRQFMPHLYWEIRHIKNDIKATRRHQTLHGPSSLGATREH